MASGALDKSWASSVALKRAGFAVIFSAIVALGILFLDSHNLVFIGDLDKYLGDWRIALFGRRAPEQRKDIAVILITEDTMLDYPARSPIDRGLLADLISAVDKANPKAIGLDFIFDRRTSQDDSLLAAICEARNPIVLGAIDGRDEDVPQRAFDIQAEFLKKARRSAGHLYLEEKAGGLSLSDQAVRRIAGSWPPDSGIPAFSMVLAEVDGPKTAPRSQEISWLLPPDSRSETFPAFRLPSHKPEDRKPGLSDLLSPGQLKALSGRIVLIGGAMADSDAHRTPLTIRDGQAIPGVFIHAQRIAQIRDGRSIWEPSGFVKFVVMTLVCLGCFAMGRRLQRQAQIYDFIGLIFLGIISIGVFALTEMILPSAAMLLAWLAGFRAGRYSSAVFEWLRLKAWIKI
jgi:adenylate cyclase